MTFGFSRDDINTFLPDYLKQELLPRDPFQSLDTTGVGQLVEMARQEGPLGEEGPQVRHLRRARRRPGLDRVLPQGRAWTTCSCSPFRVPIARLAAAQAALKQGGADSGRKGE